LVLSLRALMAPSKSEEKMDAILQLLESQKAFQEAMSIRMANLEAQVAIRNASGDSATNDSTLQPFTRTSLKLDMPRFDGSEPLAWIFKIKQFFDYHRTPEDQRLQMVAFSMEGEALSWFQWMHDNKLISTWQNFLHALEVRFAPSHYEDPRGALFKLCQTSTVREYQNQFESLANRIVGLPPPFFLSCFVSGLKPEIRREVQAFQPISLSQAISLAKLQEEKFIETSPTNRYSRPSTSTTKPTTNTNPFSYTTQSVNSLPIKPKSNPNLVAVKRLSPAELQSRREKNLCYYCDERYRPGHKCKREFMLLIAEPDDPAMDELDLSLLHIDDPTPNNPPEPPDTTAAQISLHALMGHSISQTLKVLGHVNASPVAVLVDSGSTHNFIQARIAKFLGLQVTPAQGFHVLVGNGEELACSTVCKQVSLQLGPHQFLVDLFVLPLSGAEIVLGVQWLTTLGPVLTDYEHLTMKFIKEGKVVELKGQHRTTPQEATIHQIKRMISTDGIAEYFQLQLLSQSEGLPKPPAEPEIEKMLNRYP